jgi:hypothetical protein
VIVERHLKRLFDKHRGRLEAHKGKGPAFRGAVEALERSLFGAEAGE